MMEEIKKFVEMFNESGKSGLHATGVAVHCNRIELDDDQLSCFRGSEYVATVYLRETQPFFVTDNELVEFVMGKVEVTKR